MASEIDGLIADIDEYVLRTLAAAAGARADDDETKEAELYAQITKYMLDTDPHVTASMYLTLLDKAATMLLDHMNNTTIT